MTAWSELKNRDKRDLQASLATTTSTGHDSTVNKSHTLIWPLCDTACYKPICYEIINSFITCRLDRDGTLESSQLTSRLMSTTWNNTGKVVLRNAPVAAWRHVGLGQMTTFVDRRHSSGQSRSFKIPITHICHPTRWRQPAAARQTSTKTSAL